MKKSIQVFLLMQALFVQLVTNAEMLVYAFGKVGCPVNWKIGLKGLMLSCGEASDVPAGWASLTPR